MRAWMDALSKLNITSLEVPGGVITRSGGIFDLRMVHLRAQVRGQDQQYYVPLIIAPGTDDLPFVIDYKDSIVYKFSCLGTSSIPALARCDIFYDDGDPQVDGGDHSADHIAEPYFHNKSAIAPFNWRILQIKLYTVQKDGSRFNTGWFGLPNVELEV